MLVHTDAGVEVWERGGAGPIEQLEHPAPLGEGSAANTGDDRRIAMWGAGDEIQVTSLTEGATIALRGHPAGAWTLTTSQDGQRLAAVSEDNKVFVWDLSPDGPAALGNLPTAGDIWAIEFTDDGSSALVTGVQSDTTRAHLFELDTGEELAANEVLVDSVAFDSAAQAEGITPAITIHGSRDCGEAVSIDDQSRWLLLSGCGEEGIAGQIVDLVTDESLVIPAGVGLADFGPSGTVSEGLVALQYYSPTRARIVLYDASTSRRLGSLDVTESDAWRPFFSLDGRMLTFGSFKGGAFAIDIEQVLSGTRMADAVVLNPRIGGGPTTFTVAGGEHLVTGHSGETLRFWDLETKELWLSLPVDTGDSTMIAFTPDDRYLYYEARGGVLKRFPLDPGELVALARSRVQRDFSEDECDRFLIDSDCSAYAT